MVAILILLEILSTDSENGLVGASQPAAYVPCTSEVPTNIRKSGLDYLFYYYVLLIPETCMVHCVHCVDRVDGHILPGHPQSLTELSVTLIVFFISVSLFYSLILSLSSKFGSTLYLCSRYFRFHLSKAIHLITNLVFPSLLHSCS